MANKEKIIYVEPGQMIEVRVVAPDLYGPNVDSWKEGPRGKLFMQIKDSGHIELADPATRVTWFGKV